MPVKKTVTYEIDKSTNCFICTSHAPNSAGYILVRVNGKRFLLHRLIYTKYKGRICKGIIRHSCDNTLCINPDHLIDGTQADNVQDMMIKGRDNHRNKCNSKLTEMDIDAIRNNKNLLHKDLASIYNVSRVLITNIKNHKRW